ncbi:MAG: RtcB family protein [Chloroflexi bacterium]|nr:RtcB family protein [Chloroflexota bacterium]
MSDETTRFSPLEKLDDYRWIVPTSYKPGMLVPGLIYADEHLLPHIVSDPVIEQVANVAFLPGIVRYSYAMPDIHWGYGFPVGGMAAMRLEGVISPGGVGYDLNCLHGDALVLHQFGYHRAMAEFAGRWAQERIKCVNPHAEVRDTDILAFLEQHVPTSQVVKVTTESGREIVATEDHPFLTPRGMVPLGDLDLGDAVSVYPFAGVPYEEPSDELLVTEEDLAAAYPGPATGLRQILARLERCGLLPLAMNHPGLPYLARLLGFTEGDGSLQFLKHGGSLLAFYGETEDLEAIRRDVSALGFTPSRVYQRTRTHRIRNRHGLAEFTRTESSVHCRSTALALLLRCLGATAGNKAKQDFGVPAWLLRAPLWLKRLYVAALFGAELSAPQSVTGHPYNFLGPVFSQNKARELAASGRRYLEQIQALLAEFGVASSILNEREDYVSAQGHVSVRWKLQVSSTPQNLIRLWSQVGFEYHRRKQYLANVALQYLRLKVLALEEREASIAAAQTLHRSSATLGTIVATIGSPYVNERFVERSLWGLRKGPVRIGTTFPDFPTFLAARTDGLGQTGQVWDRLIRKEVVPFAGPVYDFSVRDPHHNFIASSFVVSNCGVRLIRTDLTEDEVRPQVERLATELFERVPSGVGSAGRIAVSGKDFDQVLLKGSRWAVEQGYGLAEDLEVTEEHGCYHLANPDKVSARAKERGQPQLGTLGSGNHFLEVQVVDQVYDPTVAERLGVFGPGQVVVLIHTGSRGCGYQICDDYLKVVGRVQSRYGLHPPDRQLACTPIQSPEGQDYLAAMACGANYAWANRQCITHWVREAFQKVFHKGWHHLGLHLVYDVAHNIAKLEEHEVDGERMLLWVHRKGATRAFPPGHPDVPARYREVGQPVFIPGDMGRYSFLAVGTQRAMEQSFGTTCHGAGRRQSRGAARKALQGVDLVAELAQRGITVRVANPALLAEEAPQAYKDVAEVVEVTHNAGLSTRVARMRPLAVVKG